MTIKDRIKEKRIECGYTLDELAKKIGTSKQTIHKYESGIVSNIPSDKIEALAKALKTTPAFLMGWTESYDPLKDASWDKFREMYGMSAASGTGDDSLQPLLDAWLSLSDEGQEQLISYARFLLSQENK